MMVWFFCTHHGAKIIKTCFIHSTCRLVNLTNAVISHCVNILACVPEVLHVYSIITVLITASSSVSLNNLIYILLITLK